jgi:hypothetical protein
MPLSIDGQYTHKFSESTVFYYKLWQENAYTGWPQSAPETTALEAAY